MKPKYFLLLIAANAAWAFNPTAAKVLVSEVGPMQAALIKFGGAWFVLNLMRILVRVFRRDIFGLKYEKRAPRRLGIREATFIAVIGLTTCFLSPLLQMRGLQASSAANNSILVAMEPILTVLLSFLFFRVPIERRNAFVLTLTTVGFFVFVDLRTLLVMSDSSMTPAGLVALGDLLILGAVACEAFYSVFSAPIVARVSGFRIYYLSLTVGFLLLAMVFLVQRHGLDISGISAKGVAAGLWIGPLGTAFTYLTWIRVIEAKVPVSVMVLTLFLQPILGAILGVGLLGERFQGHQIIGGVLILTSMALGMLRNSGSSFSSTDSVRREPPHPL